LKLKNITITIATLGLVLILGQTMTSETFAYRSDPNKLGPNCTKEQHAAVQKALESKNYNEWKKLMIGKPVLNKIDEKNFAKFAEMHKLMLQGKKDEANKIRTELGLGQGQKLGNGKGMGRNFQK